MLEYDRIDVLEHIDLNKTDGFRQCIIFHYFYFLKTAKIQHNNL